MQNPSKNSTTPQKEDTPRSSPPQPTTTSPTETVQATPRSRNASPAASGAASGGGAGGGGFIGESIQISWKVMELTSGGGSAGEGGSSAVTVAAAAAPMVGGLVEKAMEKPGEGEEGRSSRNKGKQKRKGSELKDPPSGNPICPECGREFVSWKSVFGHLRVHSGRSYTGLFPPPVSPPRQPPQGGNADQEEGSQIKATGYEEGNLGTNVFGFDLNEPVEGSSAAAASSNAEKNDDNKDDSAAKFEFDLNELPAAEEDDTNIEDKKQP